MFLNFVIECCKYMSMKKDNTFGRFLRVYMIIGPCLTTPGLIFSIISTANEIRYLTNVLGFVFCFLFGLSHQVLFVVHKKLLLRIIGRVIGTDTNYPHFIDKNLVNESEKRAEEKSTGEIIFFIISSSLWAFCPYLYLITTPDINLNHADLQVLPYYYKIWKTNTITSFMMKKSFEIVFSATGLLVYYLFTIFITYTTTNLDAHIKEINRQIINVIEIHTRQYMEIKEFSISADGQKDSCFILGQIGHSRRYLYENSIDEQFVKIILYHNFIHSYTADVTKLLHWPMTAIFVWYISSTVLFAYTFLDVPDDFIYIMKMAVLVAHSNVALRLFCNIGGIIYDMNEKIKDSFYNTSWYYLSPKSRKNFSIILTLCQRKYKVKSFGMYIVNLPLFIFAVRIVYSVMNVVLMMKKKE